MHQRCMCFAFQEALMLKGRGKLTKIVQPQNEELSSNFIRPKQTVYKMSFATVSRSGTIGRKFLHVPFNHTFLPHQAPPTSKNIRKPGPKEVRLLRDINRKKMFHNGLAKHFKALAKHFKALEIAHSEKALCHERMLHDYAWQYEKEVQHDEMLKEMLITSLG